MKKMIVLIQLAFFAASLLATGDSARQRLFTRIGAVL